MNEAQVQQMRLKAERDRKRREAREAELAAMPVEPPVIWADDAADDWQIGHWSRLEGHGTRYVRGDLYDDMRGSVSSALAILGNALGSRYAQGNGISRASSILRGAMRKGATHD